MESRRKLLVTALLTAAMAVGVSMWLVRGASANKTVSSSAKAQAPQAAARAITLQAEGRSPQLRYKNAADLEGSTWSEGVGQAVALKTGDLFGAWKDMVSVHSAGEGTIVQVRAGNKDGGYELPATYNLSGSHPSGVEIGDFNADGRQDIAVLDREMSTISFLYQNDHGSFDAGPVLNVGGAPVAFAASDLDNDGLVDIVVEYAAAIRVFMGQGDFTKVIPDIISLGSIGTLTDIKVGHIGYDHFKDLVVSGTRGVAVLNGLGDGSFRAARIIGTQGVGHIAVGDLKSEGFSSIVGTQLNGDNVIVWPAKGNKGVGAPERYAAGAGMTSVAIGSFKGTSRFDIAVGTDTGRVMLLLNNSNGFSGAPISMDLSDRANGLAVGARRYGIDSLAMAHTTGLVQPEVTSGGRIDVTIIADENNCINCTVAQLQALVGTGPNFAFGGGTGISLREAMTAVNNDSVINGSSGWTIGFAGINTTTVVGSPALGGGHNPSTPQFASPGPTNSFWVLQPLNANAFGNLPPMIAAATTIDGSLVDTSVNGVNNTIGPRVQISGVAIDAPQVQIERLFFITSSAPNSNIMNLSIAGSLNDGITVAAPNCTIQGNNIGIWADGTVHLGQVNIGSGVDFQSGSINETVTNNIISNNGASPNQAGVLINGVSQSTSVPQNNNITNNRIGLNTFGNAAGNSGDGIKLQNGAVGNTITGNTISANTNDGIHETGNITADAIMQNNKIGTDAAGVVTKGQDGNPLGNILNGINIGTTGDAPDGNPKFNQISNNTISGNLRFGVVLGSGDFNPQFTTVTNNKIGTNVVGSVQIPNNLGGLDVTFQASNNTVGGTHAADGNIISGNGVGAAGPGVQIDSQGNNTLIENNLIGPNNLGAGPPVDLVAPPPQTSNKGGGVLITGGGFANKLITNFIAFNNDGSGVSGITCSSTGNFNLFSQNQIFLNPQNTPPTDAQIIDSGGGQQTMTNGFVDTTLTSLIRVTAATTTTSNGFTTVTGTANFLAHGITANINGATIEVFASQRGSTSAQNAGEAQVFIGSVAGTTFTVDPNDPMGHTLDWSLTTSVPAPFFNPVQTPTLFITATITTGDLSTSPLSIGLVSQFLTGGPGGGGGGCAVTANPTSVTFNNATVGVQASQNVVITNTGTGNIGITSATLTQTGTLFSLGTLTLPVTLTPTQTLTIPVRFTPTSAGPATATLTVADSCQNLIIPISGNPTTVKIAAIPTSLVFPDTNIGANSTASLTVINFGTGTLSITALTINGGANSPFTVVSPTASQASPFTVAGSSTATVTLKFSPTTAGTQTDTLAIVSNDPVTPSLSVGLSGTGKATVPPVVIVNQPSAGTIIASGTQFTASFGASPAQGGGSIVSFTATLSLDGGATFSQTLAGPGAAATPGVNTFIATAPNTSTTNAVIKVQVTDSNNLVGTGLSGVFTIGTPPVVTGATLTKKLIITGTGIQPGATFIVSSTGEVFSLDQLDAVTFLVGKATIGSQGSRVRGYRPAVTGRVKNVNGLTSNQFTSQ